MAVRGGCIAILRKEEALVNATGDWRARPLRIGIVTDSLKETGESDVRIANGGVGVYIDELVRALLRVDDRNHYTLLRCGGGRLPLYREERVCTAIVPATPARRLTRWLDLPYVRVVRRAALDIVHHPNQFGGLCLPRSVRQVATLHDLSPLQQPGWHPARRVLRYRLLARRALARADAVVVDAARTRDELVAAGLVERSRLAVVPLGVAARFRPALSRPVPRAGLPSPYVLSVGVLEPRKNLAALFEALLLLHQRGTPVGLVIAGRPGWRWQDPRREPRFASLLPWSAILRDVPDDELPALYQGAAAVACPSLSEGFGLPVLEAAACGVPVVASTRVPAADLLPGLVLRAAPDSPRGLADALYLAVHDADLRRRAAERAPQVARDFSWDRTALATLDVYRRVAAGEPVLADPAPERRQQPALAQP
jgi:glycosyltransferase involved in cell wall biosynthesis